MSQVDQEIWNEDGDAVFDTKKGKEFGDFLADLRDAGGLADQRGLGQLLNVSDGLSNGTVAMAVLGTERVVTWAA